MNKSMRVRYYHDDMIGRSHQDRQLTEPLS